jgi:hypothetical protein
MNIDEFPFTSRLSPHSWLIIGFVTRLTRLVPLVEQELLSLPEHLSSPMIFSGVRVTRSLVLYVCFVDRCLSFCTFSFGHCVVCFSSIYGFWLPFGIFKLFICHTGDWVESIGNMISRTLSTLNKMKRKLIRHGGNSPTSNWKIVETESRSIFLYTYRLTPTYHFNGLIWKRNVHLSSTAIHYLR